jgi:GDPmannose 4,6-dehydratase
MWRMLQHDVPLDYVVATGTAYTVRDFVEFSFSRAGLDWQKYVKFDERYLRPTEVDALIGDYGLAESALGWTPQILAPELAEIMVDNDIKSLEVGGQHWVDEVIRRG